jgi:hypothetical protein
MAEPAEPAPALEPEGRWRREWRAAAARGAAARAVPLAWGGRCVTAGRDGAVRAWGADLRPLQSLPLAAAPGAWPADALRLRMGGAERLVVASFDRSLSFFDVLAAERDPDRPDETAVLAPAVAVVLPPTVGPALSLAPLAPPGAPPGADALLAFGTTSGAVYRLRAAAPPAAGAAAELAGAGVFTAAASNSPAAHDVVHRGQHGGWVAALLALPQAGLLVSAALDGTIRIADPARGAVVASADELHGGAAVRCLAHCAALGLAASGGAGRAARLWHPRGDPRRAVGELGGHAGGVAAAAAAPDAPRAITLSGDGAVSAWDLRTLRQRLPPGGGGDGGGGAGRRTALAYDPAAGRLWAAGRWPEAWRVAGAARALEEEAPALEPRGGGGALAAAPAAPPPAAGGDARLRPHSRLPFGAAAADTATDAAA